jgi:hypothetical protein
MKKVKVYLLLFVVLLCITLLSLSFISAQPSPSIDIGGGVKNVMNEIIKILSPFFSLILGGNYEYSGKYFFEKVLVMILLFVIISLILERVEVFSYNRGVITLIAGVVSVIAVRFISDDKLFFGILLPYGTVGISIALILPFLIFAYFVYHTNMPGVGRKFSWAVFGALFILLWIYNKESFVSGVNNLFIVLIILIAIVILTDKSINAYFRGMEISKFEQDSWNNEIANLQAELARITNSGAMSPQIDLRVRQIQRRLRKLGAKYSA